MLFKDQLDRSKATFSDVFLRYASSNLEDQKDIFGGGEIKIGSFKNFFIYKSVITCDLYSKEVEKVSEMLLKAKAAKCTYIIR